MKIVTTFCLSVLLLGAAVARADPTPPSHHEERSANENGGLRGSTGDSSSDHDGNDSHRHLFEPGASVARVWIQFKKGKKKSACIKSLKSMVIATGAAGDDATTQALVSPDKDAKKKKGKHSPTTSGGSSSSPTTFQMHYDFFDMKTQSIVATVDKNMLSALAADPDVESIGRDEKRYFYDAVDKTEVSEGEHRWLQTSETIPTGIKLVQADKVWALGYKGTGVKVCVIDSGIDKGHPEYKGLTMTGVSTSAGLWYADGHGHGTHCAGTIAAPKNGLGVVGVAPEASIIPLRVFDNSGLWAYSSWVVDAAVDCQRQGAKIVSMSLGSSYYSSYEHGVYKTLYNQGVVSVAAAGNSGNADFSYPASYDVVLSVAATHSSKAKASFSQFNRLVDIAAPGVSVLSSVPRSIVANGYPYEYWSGTSMATPHVAGVAALLRQKNPNATAAQIIQAITATAEDLGNPGRDDSYGHGFIRALNAINFLASPPKKAPTKTPTKKPTKKPTKRPTKAPSKAPSTSPTSPPTFPVSDMPSGTPTGSPMPTTTASPTPEPTTATPTVSPSEEPTKIPTKRPTRRPSKKPTKRPTRLPTKPPRKAPTRKPTMKMPTKRPTMRPRRRPT